MRYFLSVIDDRSGLATPAEIAEIDEFNAGLVAREHWVLAGGLAAPSAATVVDNRDGVALITEGPFVETQEYVAGFWIVEAADLDTAVSLATEGSRSCRRRVEVRPFLSTVTTA